MSFGEHDERLAAVTVTHSPATVSGVMATAAALLAVLTAGTSILAMAVAVFGLLAVVGGLFVLESERATMVGTAFVFVGVVLSGVYGNTWPLLVLGAFASILAFDLGTNAFSVGRQLSDQTNTVRGEVVHAAASVAVGVVFVGVAVGIRIAGLEGLSFAALGALLAGALFLVWAIRE